jgi:hypothetical protein
MAAPYNPPTKNEDFIIGIGVPEVDDSTTLKVSPTIAAGDFQVSKDFGAFANLTTLPSVLPAGSQQIKITLSATEMNADVVTIRCVDQTATKEWADYMFSIPTTA